jgi:hypothetical protein
MLVRDTFYKALRAFCDPAWELFVAAPDTEDDARTLWAQAFRDYVKVIAPPSNTPPSTALVEQQFHDTLRFVPTFGVPDPLHDLAAAWRAAMASIVVPAGWKVGELALRETALRAALAALFATSTLRAAVRLGDIADAFHTATRAMPTNSNPPVLYS